MPRVERMRMGALLRTRSRRLTSAIVAMGLSGGLVAALATAHDPRDADRAGLTAGVSALERVAPERTLPGDFARWVEQSARDTGNDPARAKAEVRKLRTDLGERHSALYAYPEANGGLCVALEHQVASCAASADAGPPGIHWLTGGGWEGIPRNVVAVVSDDVVRVSLESADVKRTVAIVNNAIFAELPGDEAAVLRLEYGDGSSRTVFVPGARG
jgi:hypothetical protein